VRINHEPKRLRLILTSCEEIKMRIKWWKELLLLILTYFSLVASEISTKQKV
jgi:hypothetical protein